MNYKNPQYLVETDWLAQHLDDANLRIFDVTGRLTRDFENKAKEKCYDQGHIPGAVFLDVASAKGVLSDAEAPLRWTWPKKEQFETLMGKIGVNNESKVIIYAASPRLGIDFGTMWCTRTWWLMHHFGVQCSLLNGNWEKWVSEGYPVSTTPSSYPITKFTADTQWRRGLANKNDVLKALQTPTTCVVDALPEVDYAGCGMKTYGPRKGHITGAVNVPMYSVVNFENGVFVSADELQVKFRQAGILTAENVITYCGGAIAATVDAFALTLLGYTNVSVYDGSLLEWTADPTLPMTDPSSSRNKP